MTAIKLSEKIEVIIYILEQCNADVRYYKAQQQEAENEETNLNHELEGVGTENRRPPNYEQRAKIATQLQNSLIKRRVAKDALRFNQPLLKFIESEVGTKALNQLKQTLGELRKVESEMQERVYIKREAGNPAKNQAADKKLNDMIRDWKKQSKKKH